MIYPNPLVLSFQEWAARLIDEYASSFIPQPYEPWQDWASAILKTSVFSDLGAPRPDGYENWWDWAFELYRVSLNLSS